MPGQNKRHRCRLGRIGVGLTHQGRGHVACAVLHIEPAGDLGLLHLLARRHRYANDAFGQLILELSGRVQIEPDSAVGNLITRGYRDALKRRSLRNINRQHARLVPHAGPNGPGTPKTKCRPDRATDGPIGASLASMLLREKDKLGLWRPISEAPLFECWGSNCACCNDCLKGIGSTGVTDRSGKANARNQRRFEAAVRRPDPRSANSRCGGQTGHKPCFWARSDIASPQRPRKFRSCRSDYRGLAPRALSWTVDWTGPLGLLACNLSLQW